MNTMQKVRIAKLTLNIGAGKDQKVLDKGFKLLEELTKRKPVKTITNKRIANWGLRAGLPIGCKITLRNKDAEELLKRTLYAKNNQLKQSNFDDYGNISFGIPEYIDIKGAAYDPDIGIIGLQACLTLEKAGHRIKRRRIMQAHIPRKHHVSREEAIEFLKTNYGISIAE